MNGCLLLFMLTSYYIQLQVLSVYIGYIRVNILYIYILYDYTTVTDKACIHIAVCLQLYLHLGNNFIQNCNQSAWLKQPFSFCSVSGISMAQYGSMLCIRHCYDTIQHNELIYGLMMCIRYHINMAQTCVLGKMRCIHELCIMHQYGSIQHDSSH